MCGAPQSPLDVFWEDFIKHLRYSMVVFTREPAVERTIEFVCKFAASLIKHDEHKNQDGENEDEETEEEMPPFLVKFFDFLLQVCVTSVGYDSRSNLKGRG